MAARSKPFMTNRSQAVRLPKAVALPEGGKEVEITQTGNSRLIAPVGQSWSEWFLHGPRVSEDFMTEREQPPPEEREPL